MSQYTFDTASLMRRHTEDRIGVVKTPRFDSCTRSTLFDATYCDSPTPSRQNSMIPRSSSPRELSVASMDATPQSAKANESSRESSALLEKSQARDTQQEVGKSTADGQSAKAGPSEAPFLSVFKRLGFHPFLRK